jgi:hypothetical protein
MPDDDTTAAVLAGNAARVYNLKVAGTWPRRYVGLRMTGRAESSRVEA